MFSEEITHALTTRPACAAGIAFQLHELAENVCVQVCAHKKHYTLDVVIMVLVLCWHLAFLVRVSLSRVV